MHFQYKNADALLINAAILGLRSAGAFERFLPVILPPASIRQICLTVFNGELLGSVTIRCIAFPPTMVRSEMVGNWLLHGKA